MSGTEYINNLCLQAKESASSVSQMNTNQKNRILTAIADELREKAEYIITENLKDLKSAEETGVSKAFYDRLLLDKKRIHAMAQSVDEIAMLEDPVGRIEGMKTRPSGIRVGQMRVPLGVIAVIYESRPNVTIDIAALCIKSGNAVILRGGEESINSNLVLAGIVQNVLERVGLNKNIVSLMSNLDRDLVPLLLKRNDAIDIVIPRGGEGLVKMVTEESRIPLIKHEKGVCHLFIDESADETMANAIALNGKVQRPGVCNAIETILIHENYPNIKSLIKSLTDNHVEIRGCAKTVLIDPQRINEAAPDDWAAEYLDLIVSVKTVESINEAMDHIACYSSGHTEAIVTNNYANSERFLKEVDSAAVMVNASSRFHDGGEFGLGAEVGISTQKLHARGVMGIEGLTTLKYIVYGHGEVR